MLAKKITYTDYNGVERTEVFYFNLTKPELMEMEVSTPGGVAEKIKMAVENQDNAAIVAIYKDLILRSYGERSEDGKRFIKNKNGERLADGFAETEAYATLFMELATEEKAATEFVNGIMPQMDTTKAIPAK